MSVMVLYGERKVAGNYQKEKKYIYIVYHVNDILISTVLIIFELCKGTAA